MKKIKLLFFSVFITLLTFTSCTNDDTVNITNNVENSASVRTALVELETHFDENGRLDPIENPIGNIFFDFCFDFVYPINLTYNTGVNVSVNSFEELINIILNSTETLFINGISFPFDVEVFEQGQIVIQTISNEQEFVVLIETCGFNDDEECICTQEYAPVCVEIQNSVEGNFIIEFPNACYAACEGFTQNDFIDCENNGNPTGNDDCFEYVFPISIIVQNDVIEVNSIEELELFIFVNGNANFVYPFEVIKEGDLIIVIENGSDYIALLESCNPTSTCEEECPQDGNPVCVVAPNSSQIVEYANACLAECDGFTQNDFVDCNSGSCDITNLNVIVGECNPTNNTYSITLDFDTEFFDGYFDVFDDLGNSIIGQHLINELPITFNMPAMDIEFGWLKVCEVDTLVECCEEIQWVMPNCDNSCEDNCPQGGNPVCVVAPNSSQIVEYANACLAECDGFTQSDFVDCNSGSCDITNLNVVVGECNPTNNTYSITLDFDTEFFDGYFDVFDDLGNSIIGQHLINELPITFNMPAMDIEFGWLKVCEVDTLVECCEETQWVMPNCDNSCEDNCSQGGNEVCVIESNGNVITYANACLAECDGFTQNDFVDCNNIEDCWIFVYPISINTSGQTMIINNEAEFNANFNPNNSTLVYPFNVSIGDVPLTIETPNNFFEIGEFENRCE